MPVRTTTSENRGLTLVVVYMKKTKRTINKKVYLLFNVSSVGLRGDAGGYGGTTRIKAII